MERPTPLGVLRAVRPAGRSFLRRQRRRDLAMRIPIRPEIVGEDREGSNYAIAGLTSQDPSSDPDGPWRPAFLPLVRRVIAALPLHRRDSSPRTPRTWYCAVKCRSFVARSRHAVGPEASVTRRTEPGSSTGVKDVAVRTSRVVGLWRAWPMIPMPRHRLPLWRTYGRAR